MQYNLQATKSGINLLAVNLEKIGKETVETVTLVVFNFHLAHGALWVAKAYLLGNLAMDRRTNARQAWDLATFELDGVGYEFLDRYVTAVERAPPAAAQRAARAYRGTIRTRVARPPIR